MEIIEEAASPMEEPDFMNNNQAKYDHCQGVVIG